MEGESAFGIDTKGVAVRVGQDNIAARLDDDDWLFVSGGFHAASVGRSGGAGNQTDGLVIWPQGDIWTPMGRFWTSAHRARPKSQRAVRTVRTQAKPGNLLSAFHDSVTKRAEKRPNALILLRNEFRSAALVRQRMQSMGVHGVH